jgi:O-antigen ligase
MLIVAGLAAAILVVALFAGLRRATLWLMAIRPACDQMFNVAKFAIGSESGPGASVNLVVLTLAVVGAVFRPKSLLAAPVLGWFAFLAVAAASAFNAPDPAHSMRLLMTLATYGAVLILAHVIVRDRETAAAALAACVLSSVAPAFVALGELAANPSILATDERLLGTFTHPNILAFYLVTMIAVILFVLSSTLVSPPPVLRRVLMGWAGLLLFLLLATKTRSAWIALAMILAVQAACVDRRWLWMLAFLPLLMLMPGVGDRFLDLFEGNTNDTYAQLNSLAWRKLLWADTMEWLSQNPPGWLGHGLDHYVGYVPIFFEKGAKPDGIGTHNALLQLYFEAGILGLGSFIAVFAILFVTLARRFRTDPDGTLIAMALCGGILACSYSDNMLDYLQFQWPFWFFIGTVCASVRFPARNALRPSLRPGRGLRRPAFPSPAQR